MPRNIPARRRIDQREVDAALKIADIGRMKKSVTISLEAETLAAAIARAAAVGLTLDALDAWVESLIVPRMRAATPLHIVEPDAETIAAMKEARRGNFETVTLDDLQCALDDTDPLQATPRHI
jgi:hypothetical protein